MAQTKVRGITIELGADTSGISKALKNVNSEVGTTQKSLRDVEKLLKLDPTNTDLLAQRQRLLSDAVNQTKNKLETLKTAQQQVGQELQNTGKGQAQYDALTREIASCEAELRNLEKSANGANVKLSQIHATANKVSEVAGAVSKAMAPVTLALTAAGGAAVSAASDLIESQNKVEVAFGQSADYVKKFADTTLDAYGIARGTALDMAALFGDMGTSMGLTDREAAKMSTTLVGLSGDLASFKNISTDQAMNALKGIFTGETESLKSLGIVMTQTELKSYAMSKGMKSNIDAMSEAQKVQLRYEYVLDKTRKAQGDFQRTSDGTANSIRVFKESTKELAEQFGEVLLPIITPIVRKLTEMVKHFGDMDDKTKKVIVTIGLLVAAISPVAGIIAGVSSAVGVVTQVLMGLPAVLAACTGAVSALGVAFDFLAANPIVLVITAIVAAIFGLIAAIVLLIKNWDEVSAAIKKFSANIKDTIKKLREDVEDFVNKSVGKMKEFAQTVDDKVGGTVKKVKLYWNQFVQFWSDVWANVKSIFYKVWDGMGDAVKKPINVMIGYFNKAIEGINLVIDKINSIKIDFPKIAGGGSWAPRIPKISEIPLLAKGGVVSEGSAIVGEAGAELLSVQNGQAKVTPLTNGGGASSNSGLTTLLETYLPYLASGQNLYLDGDALVGGTASRMNSALGKIAIRGGNR